MMPESIRFRRAVWDEKTHAEVIRQCQTYEGLDYLRMHILNGDISLYEIFINESLLGVFLARVEKVLSGDLELVILNGRCYKGNKTGFTALCSPIFKLIAEQQAIKRIRLHSHSEGVNRIMEQTGWNKQETVYFLEV